MRIDECVERIYSINKINITFHLLSQYRAIHPSLCILNRKISNIQIFISPCLNTIVRKNISYLGNHLREEEKCSS